MHLKYFLYTILFLFSLCPFAAGEKEMVFEQVFSANSSPTYHYYLRDHLGSVHVVFYKFCGKELDRMHGLDWYDSQARMYDPVLTRWHTQDAKAENYYSWSPYAYCAGNPVMMVDPNGKEIWIMSGKNGYQYKEGDIYKDGKLYKGKIPSYVQQVQKALKELGKSEIGSFLISQLEVSEHSFKIKNGKENKFIPQKGIAYFANNPEFQQVQGITSGSDGSGGVIIWNPSILEGGLDENNNSNRPPYIGLGHELVHANNANFGISYPITDYTNPINNAVYSHEYKGVSKTEWRAVYGENLIRQELKIPLRKYYNNESRVGTPMITKDRQLINYP